MPSSLTVRTIQSHMPLNLRRPPETIATLLSWVWSRSLALSIGATIVWTTPPITAPAIRSFWKLVSHWGAPDALVLDLGSPSSPSSSPMLTPSTNSFSLNSKFPLPQIRLLPSRNDGFRIVGFCFVKRFSLFLLLRNCGTCFQKQLNLSFPYITNKQPSLHVM